MIKNSSTYKVMYVSTMHISTRVPKGFRAPGLQGSGLKNAGLQGSKTKIRGFRAPLLHARAPFGQKQHFCSGSESREALGSGLHDKHFRAPGLQRPPLWDPEV